MIGNNVVKNEIMILPSQEGHFSCLVLFEDLKSKGVPYKNIGLNDVVGLGIHHFFDTKNNIKLNVETGIIECIDYILNPKMTQLFVKGHLPYLKEESEADYFLVEDSIRIVNYYSGTYHRQFIGKPFMEKHHSINIGLLKFHNEITEVTRISKNKIVYPLYPKDYEKIENYLGGK